jgi:2',3'-cyclic-nucleotide 2'-phosphodiesterase (5'-nucleotidase family)
MRASQSKAMLRSRPAGALYLARGMPNPRGARDAALYLLDGDATAAPVERIVPAPDMPASALAPARRPVRLTLLHFNDLHGHLTSFTPQGDAPVFSRVVSWIRSTRTRYAGEREVAVLAVSCGDDCGGSIFDVLLGTSTGSFQVHAGYRAYSEAGVDIGVLGNHDLDRGDALLAHAIRSDARFPVLAANVSGSDELASCCRPAAIYVVGGLRIGFIGLVTPAQVHAEPNRARRITDPVRTAHQLIPALRPLCDVLIVLSHLGYSLDQQSAVVQQAGDVELARSLPPGVVTLIIGAHTHNVLNESGLSPANIVNSIPIVQAGKRGQHVGEVDIMIGDAVTVTGARLTATIDLPPDEAFEREVVQPLVRRVRPYRERSMGRAADERDLGTDAVRSEFASGESAFANFVADALANQARASGHLVAFAMIDATGVCSGLPIGRAMTFGDWFEVMPYADTLALYRLSGRDLQALLQDNARRLDRPGQPHVERGFLHFSSEVRYTIRLDATTSSAWAEEIYVDGQPIDRGLDRRFVVAATSFVRGLAGGWESAACTQCDRPVFDLRAAGCEYTALSVRDLLTEYITARGGVLMESGARRDGRLRVRPA